MNQIEVNGLRKAFGKGSKRVVAVDGISFGVKKGEIFGFLGPNGAGKTTTINIITGLLEKDVGEVRIFGVDPDKEWERVKNRVNVSTAYYPLSEVLTVRQNLKVYSKIYNVKNSREKIDRLLKMFDIQKIEDRRVSYLSSGEKTRLGLCKSLLNDPEVLFLDECTVGLDPDIAEKTRAIIMDYHRQTNCTILFTSHYMYEVEELCSRIAFMSNGKIVAVGTANELKKMVKEHTVEIAVKEHSDLLLDFLKSEDVNILFEKDNAVTFQVSSENDRIFKVMNKIFKKGFMLSDLRIKKPTLEDIFIKIARRKR